MVEDAEFKSCTVGNFLQVFLGVDEAFIRMMFRL